VDSQQSERNAFDELFPNNFGVPEQETAEGKRLDYLVHQAFQQNDAGRELLALWKETLIMQPTVQPGIDPVFSAINEGKKEFIRNILLTIERIENE